MQGVSTGDALRLVVDALSASAALQAVVGNRITGGWPQSSDLQTIPKPALVAVLEGGSTMYGAPVATLVLSVYAVSAVSSDQAMSVYDLARTVLHAESLCHTPSGHRGFARETQPAMQTWLPDATCWVAVGRYSLLVTRS
jgi:hypothetical protein